MRARRPRPALLLMLLCALLSGALFLFVSASLAADASDADLDLEDLLEVEMVSAMRRPEPLNRVAAAVTVLDEEDIRRSGALSVPDVLRLVPGLHVSHMDADKWAVGARGFNGLLSNNLLVLLDGRPVTSPTYSGVFWSSLDLPLDDIARIEVVRGPSTSLWGLDSFNGVVSIVTKSARDTQGVQGVSTVGSNGEAGQTLRIGGTTLNQTDEAARLADGNATRGTGDDLAWRAVLGGNYVDGGGFSAPGPGPGQDGSRQWRRGMVSTRVDWTGAPTDEYSIQAAYTASAVEERFGALNQPGFSQTRESNSGYGQFVWDRATGLNSGWKVRSSYTRSLQGLGGLDSHVNVLDLEIQHLVTPLGAHALMWGFGARQIWDEIEETNFMRTDKRSSDTTQWSAFGQDQIGLLDDRLLVVLGLKLDGSNAGLELQPTLRMSWCLGDDLLWAAVSRSVRSPENWRRGGNYEVHYGGRSIRVSENGDLRPEELISWEAGWRSDLNRDLDLDVSLYYNDYHDIVGIDLTAASNQATLANVLDGHTWGLEAALEWDALSFLSLRPSLAWIAQDFNGGWVEPRGDNQVLESESLEARLQALTRLSSNLTFDATLFYQSDPPGPPSEGFNLDAALSWRASEHLRMELIGKNLLGAEQGFGLLEEDPSATLRITWDF
ncbi:MAG: TonB-dependent receptor plug domain-containing protein [Desulfovibrio sp.]